MDLLSLDVEGAEMEVLRTLDLQRVNIKYVVIEATGLSASKDEAVRQYMLAHGYDLYGHLVHNDWFIRKAS